MVLASSERASGQWIPGFAQDGEEDQAPSLMEILGLFRESQQYYSGFHRQCSLEEDYYLGRRTVPSPEGIDPVWPATAGAIINVGTDHVDVNNIQIDVPAGPRSKARAERIKRFYQGVWSSIREPVLRTAVRQSFLYGIGWMKVMFDSDRWPDAPLIDQFETDGEYKDALSDFMEDRDLSFPFVVSVVNPKNLIWDDSKTRTKWAIEYTQRTVRDIQRRYPEWTTQKDGNQIAQWMEYWDEEWVAYLADDQIVWGPHKHGYGFLPYTQVMPVHSYTFEDGTPQERYRGILNNVHSLLDEEARLITQLGAIVRTTAYRTLDFAGPRAQAEEAAEDYELFGGKNVLPPGVEVRVSPMVQTPPDLFQQLNIVQTLIEQATFPNVVRGVRPKGVSSGFGISVLSGMGRLVFQGVADGLRHSIERINEKFAKLVEHKLMGRVTVHARSEVHNFDQSIGPEDIKGYYENVVSIKAEAPEEREREALLALRLHSAGVISLYEAQRRAGIINPLEEQMQINAEQLMKSPEFIQQQTQLLLERIGLPQQMEQAVAPGGQSSGNPGAMNIGGAQLQRPGERNMQAARVASQQGEPSVYPQGMSGVDALGAQLGGPTGGPVNVPSGQRIGG
mgnify:FL=1